MKSAVGACYRAMLEDGFMRRLIVWGELRSDNVINGLGTDTEIGYILNANLNEANSYCKWNDFYTVINYCNTMIQNAPMVRERDADFTEEDLNHYLAEARVSVHSVILRWHVHLKTYLYGNSLCRRYAKISS